MLDRSGMKGEDGEFPGNAGGGLVVWKGLSSGKACRLGRLVVWGKPDVQEGFAVRGRGVVQERSAVRERGARSECDTSGVKSSLLRNLA